MQLVGRPVDERVFVEALLGRKRPITEQDFSKDELALLKHTIDVARERRSQQPMTPDVKAYFDAGNGTIKPADYVYATPQRLQAEPWKNPISNTIGTSHYHANPDGSKQVIDNYDWHNDYDDWLVNQYRGLTLAKKIAKVLDSGKLNGSGLLGQTTAENLAAAFMPDASIPVSIRVPAKADLPVLPRTRSGPLTLPRLPGR